VGRWLCVVSWACAGRSNRCDSEWHFRGFNSYGFKALSLGYCAKCGS